MSATITFAPDPRVIRRTPLPFSVTVPTVRERANYDVSRDGQRFVTVRAVSATEAPVVVTGWIDEVREKLKPRR